MHQQSNALGKVKSHRWDVPWVVRVLWRYFVTGRDIRQGGDNATLFHDATLDYRARPYVKLSRARWRRLSRRWALLGVPMLFMIIAGVARIARWAGASGWAALPWLDIAAGYGALALAGGITYGVQRLVTWLPQRQGLRMLILPAYEMLCKELSAPYRKRDAIRHIELGKDSARVYMPRQISLDEKAKARLCAKVGRRLGMPDAVGSWTEATDRVFVDLAPQPLPPRGVTLAGVREAVAAAEFERPVAGPTYGGRIVHLDFVNDSPHVMVAAGAGAGKSTLYRFLMSQRLSHGSGAIILDIKRWSLIRPLMGVGPDQVLYFHEVAHIHEALVAVMDETIRRKRLTDPAEFEALRPIDIVVEEKNTLQGMLADYWTEYVAHEKQAARTAVRLAKLGKDEDEILAAEEQLGRATALTRKSPALQAMKYGVNMGRELNMFWHFVMQSGDANATGGRDVRASFNSRFMGRWNLKDWRMLADGIPYVAPPPDTEVGVWALVSGGKVEIIRVPFLTDDEARTLALSGRPEAQSYRPVASTLAAGMDAGRSVVDGLRTEAESYRPVAATILPSLRPELVAAGTLPAVPAAPERPAIEGPATLRTLADLLPEKAHGERLSLDALRWHAKGEAFPAPVGREGRAATYDRTEVERWYASVRGSLRASGHDER